jgi:hypothetical protein
MARIATKWPLLLVAGKPVTPEQADDILLRSCGGYFTGNDPGMGAADRRNPRDPVPHRLPAHGLAGLRRLVQVHRRP